MTVACTALTRLTASISSTLDHHQSQIISPSGSFYLSLLPTPPTSTLFPYTTLFRSGPPSPARASTAARGCACRSRQAHPRSEEHTSELQSRGHLVCRLLLEKKKKSHHFFGSIIFISEHAPRAATPEENNACGINFCI